MTGKSDIKLPAAVAQFNPSSKTFRNRQAAEIVAAHLTKILPRIKVDDWPDGTFVLVEPISDSIVGPDTLATVQKFEASAKETAAYLVNEGIGIDPPDQEFTFILTKVAFVTSKVTVKAATIDLAEELVQDPSFHNDPERVRFSIAHQPEEDLIRCEAVDELATPSSDEDPSP